MSILLRYRKLGLTITFRVDAPELESLARDLQSSALDDWATCPRETPADLAWTRGPREQWQILLRGQVWMQDDLSSDSLFLQSDSLLDDFVRERLPAAPMLHAGAVVSPGGIPIGICGASGAGKTSLVLACVLRHWGWLTDELLCFRTPDPLLAEGFRRNFNIKERSFANFMQTAALPGSREFELPDTRRRIRFINPNEFSHSPFVETAHIRAFVVPLYRPDVSHSSIAPLSAAGLVHHLAPELRATHTDSIAWLGAITRSVQGYELRYRDPHEAVDRLETLTEQL